MSLDNIKVTCDGIPFDLQTAIDYGLNIDADSQELASVVSEGIEELPTEEQLWDAESKAEEWEEKFEAEQERADGLDDQLEEMSQAHDALEIENEKLSNELDKLKAEFEKFKEECLPRQVKAKNSWIEKLLRENESLGRELNKRKMADEL